MKIKPASLLQRPPAMPRIGIGASAAAIGMILLAPTAQADTADPTPGSSVGAPSETRSAESARASGSERSSHRDAGSTPATRSSSERADRASRRQSSEAPDGTEPRAVRFRLQRDSDDAPTSHTASLRTDRTRGASEEVRTATVTPDKDTIPTSTASRAVTGSAPPSPSNSPVADLGWALFRRNETSTGADIAAPPTIDATISTIDVGEGPSSVAIDADDTLTYVANADSGTVSVVYNPTGEVIRTIASGGASTAIVLNPGGTRAYTANPNVDSVSVIDTAKAEVLSSITVGSSPSALAISPNGARLYVANLASSTVSVIDTARGEVMRSIRVGGSPTALAVSASGRRMYVADYERGQVVVVNTGLFNVVSARIRVGGNPNALALTPDGRRLYVTDDTGGSVSVISTLLPRVISSAPIFVGGYPDAIAVSADGTRVYVADFADDTISVIDAASGVAYARIATGAGPSALALARNGNVFVTNALDGTVSVIDASAVPAPDPSGPSPVARVSTEGFTVLNVTGRPIVFTGYWKSDERPENGGPGIGTVIPPGGSIRFEVIYRFLRTTIVYPQFSFVGSGASWNLSMTVGTVGQTSSSCAIAGNSRIGCKISNGVPGDQKFISLLDIPGTVANVDNAQEQAELLSAYCRQSSLGTCTFKVNGPEVDVLTPPHQVGNTVRNPSTNPTTLTKTLSLSDAVTNSDSVTVTAKVSIAFLDKLVNAELTQAYGHVWTNTRTFTEQYTVTVPPGYESRIFAEQPIWRAYGTFTIVAGNTTLNLINVYVDTPNTDPNASGVYTVRTTPYDDGLVAGSWI